MTPLGYPGDKDLCVDERVKTHPSYNPGTKEGVVCAVSKDTVTVVWDDGRGIPREIPNDGRLMRVAPRDRTTRGPAHLCAG